ncbi:Air1p [Saccharomyces cerevisiae x Saccharomyces kudriavzevii VIN7]|uniref:Air1p n=1 Tax=Saccharomyces cerevisiae x Saccharomyces kudriavzevii (strain VIN7) TaxID=1095631 RepID=H0GW96_SACCK|nr:Air1p [Saccharomyces cerevisiae x Saccharomyces kudriavzevii VIN7]
MSTLLSEVESMDTLSYVKDTAATAGDPSSSTKLLAPSIQDVDADPEELRTLRGQGRYFGIRDYDADGAIMEAEPKCNNCSQRGHLKRNCPHVTCTYCGFMDDHYSQHCPKAIICSNCNANGHYKSQCPHKWKKVVLHAM